MGGRGIGGTRRLGTSPSATFLLRPWAVVVRATVVGVAGRRRNSSRIAVRDMLSYQSLIPAAAGTAKYEKLALWFGTADSATPLPDPSGGQAPALHFLIAPTTIGQQLGTFRWWRTGIVIESRAHSRDNGRTRQVLLRLNNNARQTTEASLELTE